MLNIDDLAKQHGLDYHDYDTDLPIDWVNGQRILTEAMSGIAGGIPLPWGFVWCYKVSKFGEPLPLTDAAKMYAEFVSINPRVWQDTDWKLTR